MAQSEIPLPSDGFLFDLLKPWDVRALSTRKTADLPLQLRVGTFRGYRILFSIRNPYINRFTNHFSIHSFITILRSESGVTLDYTMIFLNIKHLNRVLLKPQGLAVIFSYRQVYVKREGRTLKPELSMLRSCPNRFEFKNECYSTVNQSISKKHRYLH